MANYLRATSGYLAGPTGRPMSRVKFTPTVNTGLISGAVAIWDATVGVSMSGPDIVSWTDSVGSLALTASGTPSASTAPSGRASILFDSVDYLQASSTGSLPSGASPRTVIAVMKADIGGTQWGGFTYGADVNYQGYGISISGQTNNICSYYRGAVLEGISVNDGAWYIVTTTYDGNSNVLYLNKTLLGTQTVTLNTGTSRIRVLKSDTAANPPRNGSIGAVYVYPFAFTQSQVDQMVDYLTTLWLDAGTVTTPSIITNLAFTATSQNTGDISFDIDDFSGQGWYIVTSQSGTPTIAQIKNGLDSLGNAAASANTVSGLNNGSVIRGIASLSPSTTYFPYAYWENSQGAASTVTSGTSGTTDAVTPPPTGNIDAVALSASALESLAQSWNGTTNWNATAAGLGKTTSETRTIGLPVAIAQDINLDNIVFPQKVYIRTVGSFANDVATTSPITGFVTAKGATNIVFDRLEFRVPTSSTPTGWVNISGSTDVIFDRCAFKGIPFPYQAGSFAITRRFMTFGAGTTTTRPGFTNCVIRNVETAFNWDGTTVDMTIDGWFGELASGDDLGDIAKNGSGGFVNGITLRGFFGDRTRAKIVGRHCDSFQSFQAPARITNLDMSYCVLMRGPWIDTGETAGVGWRFFIGSGSSVAGASTVDNCLFANAHKTGHDRPKGNTIAITNCAYLFGTYPLYAFGNAPYPRPEGFDNWLAGGTGTATNCYQMIDSLGRSDVLPTSGTGNIVRVTPGTWTSPDFSSVAGDLTNVPTEDNFLWDIRPVVSGALDPNGTANGPYDLWAKLYAGDPIVCKSVVGWPVAEMFIKWFDPGNNFAGGSSGYTGNYDSDGNNV